MARNTLIVLLLAGLIATPALAAKLYKWVDERGNVSYQDRPPPEGVGRVEEKTVSDGVGGGSGSPAASEAALKSPVTLYSVPRCSPCDAARLYLKKRGVPFTEVNVSEKNPKAQEEMRKKIGELTVPSISVGSKIMQGYVESLLNGELDQAGYPKMEEKPEKEEKPDGAAPEDAPAQ